MDSRKVRLSGGSVKTRRRMSKKMSKKNVKRSSKRSTKRLSKKVKKMKGGAKTITNLEKPNALLNINDADYNAIINEANKITNSDGDYGSAQLVINSNRSLGKDQNLKVTTNTYNAFVKILDRVKIPSRQRSNPISGRPPQKGSGKRASRRLSSKKVKKISKKMSKKNSKSRSKKGKKMSGAGKKRLSKSKRSRRMSGGAINKSPPVKSKEDVQNSLDCNFPNTVNTGDCVDTSKWNNIITKLNSIIQKTTCPADIIAKSKQLRDKCDTIKSTGKVTGVDPSGYTSMGKAPATYVNVPPRK